MDIAAFVVSFVSAVAAVSAVWYARRSDRSASKSAVAAETTAALDRQRRNAELTPRFLITCEPANPGIDTLRLRVLLSGPPELGQIDRLTVSIRDDHPFRSQVAPLAGGPTSEQVAGQIWGPYCFTPGTGPIVDPARGFLGADHTGRTTPNGALSVGEAFAFHLEPTQPPRWSQQPLENWRKERGTVLRLRLECQRADWEPWVLTGEIDTAESVSTAKLQSPVVAR